MKGDFTRFGFDAGKHFSRVLQQQGRVTLDADGNESTAILLHHLRALTRDLYGDFGGPANGAFSLALDETTSPATLWISPGHYYVAGILCENDDWVAYGSQPDWVPAPPAADGSGGDPLLAWLRQPAREQSFWLALDVWERHVSWIQDDALREPALGGPDTCTRARVVWQVKALAWDPAWGDPSNPDIDFCAAPLAFQEPSATGRLAAQLDPGPAFTDPCVIAPGARYRGLENQLYRVEVHTGGDASTATFKWSRDNGSVATRWLGVATDGDAPGTGLQVLNSRGFTAGDWVELSHDALELAGQPGQLVRVAVVDGDQLTLDAASLGGSPLMAWSQALSNPCVRRWDQRGNDVVGLRGGAIPIVESTDAQANWIPLEDGLQVEFAPGGLYRSGDYWTIPARVATQGIDWPQDDGRPALLAPQGIVHAYAPLGRLSWNGQQIGLQRCRTCFGLAAVECAIPAAPAPAPATATGVVGTRAPARVAAAPAPSAAARKRRKT